MRYIASSAYDRTRDKHTHTGGAQPECEQAYRDYISGKPKVDGNTDYLPRRFEWDIDFIRLYT